MSSGSSLPRTLKTLIDEQLQARGRVARGLAGELSPVKPYFPPPGGGDDYELNAVTSLSVPGGSALQGDLVLAGGEGLVASQVQSTITLAPPALRHQANPRTPLAACVCAPLAARSIYLEPWELSGSVLVTALYLMVERIGEPNDDLPLIEAAVYKRNQGDDGFTRAAHFGVASFNGLTQLATGKVYRHGLTASTPVCMGQYFLGLLYRYEGPGAYHLGVCPAEGAHYPGSGIYLSGVAGELPPEIPDSSLSMECSGLVWVELSGA